MTMPAPAATAAQIYTARLTRAQSLLHANGFDYLFVGPSADLIYLTGIDKHISERMTLLVVHQTGPAYLVVPAFEAGGLPALPDLIHVAPWQEHEDPAALVRRLLEVPGGASACTVAVGDYLAAVFLLRLQAALPWAACTPAQLVLPALRLIKDEAEVALLREAGARADAAFVEFQQVPFAGRSETDVAGQLAEILRRKGLATPWGPIVASGPNGASPHHTAADRVIQPGDLVVLDFGGVYRGYNADMTRTVAVEHPPEAEALAVYEQVRAAQAAAFQAARPGMTCQALDAIARDLLNAGGYGRYFTHRLGHGIGLDGHEAPYLVTGNTMPLQAGMAFSIEPGLYLPGRFGVRIEDSVVLHADGAESMNNSPRELLTVH